MQPKYTRTDPDIPLPDSPQAPACPWCGHRPTPYAQQASNLLDTIALLQAVVADLKQAAEEVVL